MHDGYVNIWINGLVDEWMDEWNLIRDDFGCRR